MDLSAPIEPHRLSAYLDTLYGRAGAEPRQVALARRGGHTHA